MSTIELLPLESNPAVMNKYLKNLGVTGNFGISDIVSLEEEFLNEIPTPSLALVFLYPVTSKCAKFANRQEKQQQKMGDVSGVYYMKQTIVNACGTIALIHAVANNESFLEFQPDSVLKKFLDTTRDLSPEERGKNLEQNEDIIALHKSCAEEGQTQVPSRNGEIGKHFITLVNINDQLVELDGYKSDPIVHGAANEESFLKDAVNVCKEYIKCEPDNHNFSALAFGAM